MDIGYSIIYRFGKSIIAMAIIFFSIIFSGAVLGQGEISCSNITVGSQPGLCGATITLPSPCSGGQAQTSFYTVGTHNVPFTCPNGSCVVVVTVLDTEGPMFPSCEPVTVNLGSGECGPNAFSFISVIDNCDTPSGITISPAAGNPYSIDHEFRPGTYNLSYIATDRAGNSSSCTMSLTVVGVPNRVTSVTCYKDINVTVGPDCYALITPQMMLEGGPYGCLDDYIVTIYDAANRPLGNTVGIEHINQKLKTEVLSPDGNRCWGWVTPEDKTGPELLCDSVYTTCSGDFRPGAPLPTKITYAYQGADKTLPVGSTFTKEFNIPVFGINSASIFDIDVFMDLSHTSVNQLSAQLVSPSGTMIQLFNAAGSCTGDDIYAFFDDEATMAASAFADSCHATGPAKMGRFKAIQNLSGVEGGFMEGVWKIVIADNSSSDGGKVNALQIIMSQTGGTIPFPTDNEITYTKRDSASFIVYGIDNCTEAILHFKDSIVNQDCASAYEKIIYRTWRGVDAFGNQAQACTQPIFVYRNDISTLIWPKNFDDIDTTVLSCLIWGDSIPGPEVTGRPHGEYCRNVQVFPYEDHIFRTCGNSYKILRRWTVSDWCTGRILYHDQIIKVADHEGPVLDCPAEITVSADYDECAVNLKPKKPTALEECSDSLHYILAYYVPDYDEMPLPEDALFTRDGVVGDSVILNLSFGVYYIQWTVIDECFNTTECITKVIVNDQITPVAVCRLYTTVSIGAAGGAEVDAKSFDDNSYDNCEIVKYEALKMTDACGGSRQYSEKIRFCCEEVGKTVMVAFRVTDASGNSNTCMVEVKVEDKLPPYIYCPDDITLDCTVDYKDTTITGTPIYGDNCGVKGPPTFKDSVNIDQCGRGWVIRTWSVTDKRGYTTTCKQHIHIINTHPFDEDYIMWPENVDTMVCNANLHPDSLSKPYNRPMISHNDCSLTAVNWKDQVFEYAPGSCVKILRKWTVIDWCNYNERYHTGIYEYVQILKISNDVAPEFVECKDVTIDVFDNCKGRVVQSKSAEDDCTPSNKIKYYYTIDLYSDGINDNLFGNGDSFDRILPVGKHKIKWTADDLCGNIGACTYYLTVRDGKKPTPYCLSSVTTVVMPSTGSIGIWAKDFDFGSSDNCTPKNKLKFSFSADVLDTGRIITCADIPDGKSLVLPLRMWVTDEAGNQEYCDVSVIIQDNTGNICPDNNNPQLHFAGNVFSLKGQPIAEVAIELSGTNLTKKITTLSDGLFDFGNVRLESDLILSASKDDKIRNGLNTLDLVMIQKHILAIDRFKNTHQMLASDFNKDGRTNVQDLVSIRKIILGVEASMPDNGKPWRFFNEASIKGNDLSSMTYEEKITLYKGEGSRSDLKFVGVRLGDVDDSATKTSLGQNTRNRNENAVDLKIKTMDDGRLAVYVEDVSMMYGMQFSLAGINKKEGVVLLPAQLNVAHDAYVFTNSGILNLSWFDGNGRNINPDEPILYIETSNEVALENLRLVEEYGNELYDEDMAVRELILRTNTVSEKPWSVGQNAPNPFSQSSNIEVYLPREGVMSFRVFDGLGRILIKENTKAMSGSNVITVEASQLSGSGVYLYEVIFEGERKLGKMILSDQ